MTIHEVVPGEESLNPEEQYTIFHPSEVELSETIAAVLRPVEAARPARVAIDSLSELRLLARDPLRYRHQMLALKQFFAGRSTTVLLLDNIGERESGLASIAHTVILLEQLAQEYGGQRRRLRGAEGAGQPLPRRLPRLRHRDGRPRRVSPAWWPPSTRSPSPRALVPSGVAELD